MREGRTKLGREADMATAYLGIQQLRMGTRLAFSVDVPAQLRRIVPADDAIDAR